MSCYSRDIKCNFRNVEVDGHGGVDIEYTNYDGYGQSTEVICLDFEDIEKAYFAARAQRIAYQAFVDRGHEDTEQYERDYQEALRNEVAVWRALEEK